MKKVKVNPESYANDAYELDDVPNNRTPRDHRPASDQLKIIANVGVAAKRWQKYSNTRRKAKGMPVSVSVREGIIESARGKDTTDRTLSRNTSGSGLAPDLNEEVYGCYQTETDGTTDVIKSQIETVPNRSLIQYFARLSNPDTMEQLVDLEFVSTLVENGADVNCTDVFGQCVLHEVARTWHCDVARFLITELGANIDQSDRWGRTPLHVAASVDYAAMCDYLIEAGADKEARTEGELQTPVFYAARNDSVLALKTLIKRGCDFKRLADYKHRTPLAVAAELDRSETAKLLLELGAPADVRDDSGQPVMVPLIMKMAPVAKEALHQFHQKDRANRKQYYYLGRLDPTAPEEILTKKYQSALQLIVNYHHYELALHSATLRLIQVSWDDFAKWRAIGSLFFQLAYILSWSVFGVASDWTERYKYNLPTDVWRIIVFAIAVILTVWQMVEEILEYRSSSKKHEEWKKWRLEQIARDEHYCHPRWPEEREYLEQEKDELDSMAPAYFNDAWNIFDWICYLLLMVCIITHVVDIGAHSLQLARWHIRIMAVTIIILWLRFLKVCRAFSLVGPFIVILGHMLSDVARFVFLYLDFYIPFAFAFWMLIGGRDNIPEDNIAQNVKGNTTIVITGFDYVHNLLFSMFRLTLVDDYDYDNMIKVDHIMAQLLVGSWFALSAILCVNLFIALLSDTFVRVYDNAQANSVMQKAITILHTMDGLSESRRKRFHSYLLESCDPESLYYDDDTTPSGDEDLRKATIEVRDDVAELKEKFQQVFGTEEDDNPLMDTDGTPFTPRRKSLLSSSTLGVLGKNYRQLLGAAGAATKPKMSPFMQSQAVKNLNMITTDTFEREMDAVKDQLSEVREVQAQMDERMRADMAAMRSILQDLAVVITGGMRPDPVQEPLEEPPRLSKKKKKKPKQRGDEEEEGAPTSSTRGILRVAPAAPPMQIETYSADGSSFLPPVTFPDRQSFGSEDV